MHLARKPRVTKGVTGRYMLAIAARAMGLSARDSRYRRHVRAVVCRNTRARTYGRERDRSATVARGIGGPDLKVSDEMSDFAMADQVVVFKGLDTEKWSIRPESCFAGRLDDAIRHVIQNLSSDEQHDAFIRRIKDRRVFKMDEIKALYGSLGSN
jgi:hypothetical protein